MNSIVVRIEPQDVLFILNATEPGMATRSFAETLARRTALSAIEKDIPAGIELALSARRLDQIPPEIENRLPDFYMDGNWKYGFKGTKSLNRKILLAGVNPN